MLFASHSARSQLDVSFRATARTAGIAGFRKGCWLIQPPSLLSLLSSASLTTLPVLLHLASPDKETESLGVREERATRGKEEEVGGGG